MYYWQYKWKMCGKQSIVFLYCRFSLFLKDPFSRLFRGRNTCRCFCVELLKLLHVHRYSVDISFHILVRQEYWVLGESRIPLKPVLGRRRENCCTFHKFSWTDSIKPSHLLSYIEGSLYFWRIRFSRLFSHKTLYETFYSSMFRCTKQTGNKPLYNTSMLSMQ